MAQHPNTFLSRVFGVNSQALGGDTEMSSIADRFRGDEESETSQPHSRLRERSVIQSDDDDTSDSDANLGESSQYHNEHSTLLRNDISDSHFLNHLDAAHEDDEDGFDDDDDDDAVPMSLMVQADPNAHFHHQEPRHHDPLLSSSPRKQTPIPSFPSIAGASGSTPPPPPPSSSRAQPQQQSQQPPISHRRDLPQASTPLSSENERIRRAKLGILNPRERALWKWANVENLDKFLQDVYAYYLGSGYYCIMLKKVFDLATLMFVVLFATYLSSCINYPMLSLPSSKSLGDITVDQCFSKMSWSSKLCLWLFYIYCGLKVAQLYMDSKSLEEIQNFYNYLLEISDNDLQTISWQVVVGRVQLLKNQNAISANVSDTKSKSKIDAHDIANRIMRKDNYYIALFNRDVLDLTLPIPFYKENILTKTLEWNLQLCISGLVFNDHGQIRQQFLKENKRKELSEELKKRFKLAAILNIVLSPLLVSYFLLLYFFRYFNEYQKNPGSIGSRQYTPLAEWKFREYNELYHIFQRRLNLSVPEAAKYVDQFPKEKMVVVLKFVAFISGSFAAVLGILSIVDPDMFFNFEITKDRTVLFYISVFGTIWAVCRGAIPDEYQVFDSEASIRSVAEYTHYLPTDWEGRYHTEEVRNEFCNLFSMKVLLLMREISSLVMTPFILWFSLPKSTDRIVDFFREYSVHVDGLGYVCTFAMFDFEKTKSGKRGKKKNKFNTGEDKMMQSYIHFLDSYGGNETQRNPPRVHKNNLNMSIYDKVSTGVQHPHHIGGSVLMDPTETLRRTNGPKLSRGTAPLSDFDRQGLGESFITTLPKTDAVPESELTKDPGVLGLLNQFYKDYDYAH
ncbi:CYFA0S01e18756g1_1 [Cyberlindnera fabianii]|uniref:Autophagy-related protein 9 n=1 Tax=Cyberlindnera fabianii TaxID=36022 RepID=A0A061ARA6_CYBFA|nr:CYFA0S01e18756g1_1 [Cyberlindnera fabianii]